MKETGENNSALHVLIVGCGLGGLTCAIACLREGLNVTILEQAPELGEVGAGIQLPPNAVRVMEYYGLMPELVDAGAVKVESYSVLRYHDGRTLASYPGDEWTKRQFGHSWYVIHRADYHRVLLNEALRLGAVIHIHTQVMAVDSSNTSVLLKSRKRIYADVIIGGDGIRSVTRDEILGYREEPVETGDLAYRALIPRGKVEALGHPFLDEAIVRCWIGPDQHAVFYPIRHMSCFNLVLLCADDLAPGVGSAVGNTEEMRALFRSWDPDLLALIDQVDDVLKFKLCQMNTLERWSKRCVTLLGDACHATLPYQGQGAAMAVEDAATLGILLGRLAKSDLMSRNNNSLQRIARIAEIVQLYETIRKDRTTSNVQGATETRSLFHMRDKSSCIARDDLLATIDWEDEETDFPWGWGNLRYLKEIMGMNAMKIAEQSFETWLQLSTKRDADFLRGRL